MPANWRVSTVSVISDFTLGVRFMDGLEGIVRFSPDFFQGVFSHLSDINLFCQVGVVGGAVTWPGYLDLAPDTMYKGIKKHGEWTVGSKTL